MRKAVVDVGLKGAQRERAHASIEPAAHLGTAQATGQEDADTLGAVLHRALGTHFDNASITGALLELLSDAFGHQLGADVGVLDLVDHDGDFPTGHVLELFGEAIDLGAFGPDDQTRAGGLDDDLELFACAFDVDVGDGSKGRRAVEAFVEELADAEVFDEQLAIERLGCVPAALVCFGDADAEPEWVCFLSHVRRSPRRRWSGGLSAS